MSNNSDELVLKLNQLQDLYENSKSAILIYEAHSGMTPAGPHNEMRNALDHIMRMINNPFLLQKEYYGARSHILRAGYDAWELLCINRIDYIKETLKNFTPADISIGFPSYYNEVKPAIQDIEEKTVELRERKQKNRSSVDDREAHSENEVSDENKGLEYYLEEYKKLDKYVKKTNSSIAGITESMKRNKCDKIRNIVVSIIIGIATTAICVKIFKW